MNSTYIELESFAQRLQCALDLPPAMQAVLSKTPLLFIGFGSLARPLSELLAKLGSQDLTLVDPKRYTHGSVASQCEPAEVDRLKVEVGRERLTALGARVISIARDASAVPDGVVGPQTLIVASVDNPRAAILANRLAARMRSRLIKLNVEPQYGIAAVRCYDYRFASLLCLECQFSDRQYQEQRHPRSCDGPAAERPTNSPRELSQAAAQLAAVAVLQLEAGEAQAAPWHGHELQYALGTSQVQRSQLTSNTDCRWDHGASWPNLVRLADGPDDLCLLQLLAPRGRGFDASAAIRFCAQVAMESRCRQCGNHLPGPRWIAELEAPGVCPACGGDAIAIPFWARSRLGVEELRPVLLRPLANWGVEPGAVIEVTREGHTTSYIIGPQKPKPSKMTTDH